jgi:hypothetical protein
MPRHVAIDKYAYHERAALLEEAAEADGIPIDSMQVHRQAAGMADKLPFSVAATAAANGNWEPAKDLCRAERAKRGQANAMVLWEAIQEAVAEAHALG